MEKIIGREQQLASLDAFIEHVQDRPVSLLLDGEPGSGKTTLWLHGSEAARAAGVRILTARPLEAEAGFSFSAIGDLLAETHDVIDALPEPQARALRIALLLVPAGDAPADERAVGLGLLGVLRRLAEESPVVVAVDDLQWLDEPSARALGFAARRLDGERVGLLAAARPVTPSLPFAPERAFPALTRVPVGPLTRDEVHRLAERRLAVTLSRPALQDVYTTSGGNPLYALELARAVAVEADGSRRRLAVPPSLRELIGARIATLSSSTRHALLVASALADPTLDVVSAAIGGDATRALEEAVDADVAEISTDGRVRFVHPLLAAAAYDGATESARRETHALLARLTREREERARHLALASSSPSEEVAAELEAAAHAARARGAPVVAGELAELSAQLTPATESAAARRRRLDAAFWIFEAGDSRRARAILEALLEQAEPGAERARILVNLATVRSYDDDIRAARDLFLAASGEHGADDEIRMRAHDGVAGTSFRLRANLHESVQHAAEAAARAEALGRDDLLGEALGSKAIVEAILGREEARETAKTALALRNDDQGRRIMRDPAFAVAVVELWHDELEEAAARFQSLADRARELGDESSIPYLHVMMGQLECVRGRPAEAARLTRDALDHARQAGQETLVAYLLGVEAWACAYAGDETATLELASQSLELAERTNGVPAWFFATSALGQLAVA
ncbi:MAG TPA: AAA family ATPase, partial [Gaiella sp.]|nr:AAA family ATPase [Gaiella sp.]